jgi:hypothetical protein
MYPSKDLKNLIIKWNKTRNPSVFSQPQVPPKKNLKTTVDLQQ